MSLAVALAAASCKSQAFTFPNIYKFLVIVVYFSCRDISHRTLVYSTARIENSKPKKITKGNLIIQIMVAKSLLSSRVRELTTMGTATTAQPVYGEMIVHVFSFYVRQLS